MGLRAHPLDPLYESRGEARNETDLSAVDVEAFLPALAAMLREAALHFEGVSGRVTDLVIGQCGQAAPDLVVALQDFDRLQQELAALGEALLRYLAATGKVAADADHADVIGGIPLDDVKQRLLRRLQAGMDMRIDANEREF
jgi:hypothetical protein